MASARDTAEGHAKKWIEMMAQKPNSEIRFSNHEFTELLIYQSI